MLSELLDSIIQVKSLKCEVIIVDDHSTDSVYSVIKNSDFGKHKLTYIRNKTNRGAPYSRNRGIEAATGDFIQFSDSDDVLAPSGIEEIVYRLAAAPNKDFAHGRVQVYNFGQGKNPEIEIGGVYSKNPRGIIKYSWHTMGAIYRRSFLKDQVGYWNEDLTGSQDWEYQARIKMAAQEWLWSDTVLGYWRQHGDTRVGTRTFRPDYAISAGLACLSIWREAKVRNLTSKAAYIRLIGRALLHALQCGAHGDEVSKEKILGTILSFESNRPLEKILWNFRLLPQASDRAALKLLAPHMLA